MKNMNLFLSASALLLSLSLAPISGITALADTSTEKLSYITDDCALFTGSEWEKLSDKAEKYSQEYACDLYVLTFNAADFGDYPIDVTADDIYEAYQLGYENSRDGVVFALDPYAREYALFGRGDFGSRAMSSDAIIYIEEQSLSYLGSDQWYQAMDAYLDSTAAVLNAARTGTAVSELKPVAKAKAFRPIGYLYAAIVGLLIAFGVTGAMKGQMKTARIAADARNYVPAGGTDIRVREDRYLRTTRTERVIQSSSGKSGGGPRPSGSGGSGKGKF